MIAPPVRALIVDDEPLARRALRSLVGQVPWIACVGEAEDGPTAIARIEELEPEMVFLDVQMPGASGLDVLTQLDREMVVIFTTAFDSYAVTAFEYGAIDYLRKPFGLPRFTRAVERALPQLEAMRQRARRDAPGATSHAGENSLRERLSFTRELEQPLQRLFVRDRGVAVPINVSDVTRFEGDGDFVAVHVGRRRYLVYVNLGTIAAQLDPTRFVRVHRSHVINLDAIVAVAAFDANRLEVRTADG
ncbi:MAG: LytR/AlgR family response regulator transcription factor, partial [Gemmatimonadaceae bacterium]